MYRRADRALFDAKQSGRDRARFAPPIAVRAALRRFQLRFIVAGPLPHPTSHRIP